MARNDKKKLKSVQREAAGHGWAAEISACRCRMSSAFKAGGWKQWLVAAPLGFLLALAIKPPPWPESQYLSFIGTGVIATMVLAIIYQTWQLAPSMASASKKPKDLVFLGLILVIIILIANGWQILGRDIAQGLDGVMEGAVAFGAPLSAGPLLASLFLGGSAGLMTALVLGVTSTLIWPENQGLMVYFLLTGMVAAFQIRGGNTRSAFVRAGVMSSLTGFTLVAATALANGWLLSINALTALIATWVSGLLGGVLATGVAPLMEWAFGYASAFRLMEQGSLDHPALRELMMNAPGTYHHSLVVGSMVEAAAREIGADHLLAKTAAMYHDIGKIKKPAYFVENQMGGPNRHEKLAPSMSALILISHLKEGLETAKRYKLSQPIIDIMAQHHGTRLIKFFYNKALVAAQQAGQSEPDFEAYRYPGPKPQTREAALVMLADTVEAAARSLDNPTPSRIRGLVQTQINAIFAEGQLDECELTLKDLHSIAKIFITILTGIFHQRVEYPGGPEKSRNQNGDNDRQPPESQAVEPERPVEQDKTNLKRLGMQR